MRLARQEPALAMMLSLYATLGIFLLLAVRNPSVKPQPGRLHGMDELCSRRCHPTTFITSFRAADA
jgi:hypothetical protein